MTKLYGYTVHPSPQSLQKHFPGLENPQIHQSKCPANARAVSESLLLKYVSPHMNSQSAALCERFAAC